MPTPFPFTYAQALVFVLVFCRVGGLVATAPAFGAFVLPWRFRALLACAITLVVAPACCGNVPHLPSGLLNGVVLAGGELLIGVVLGAGVAILLSAALVAGQLIGQMSGISLSEVLQPENGETTSAHAQLLYLVALTVYVALGGQRLLIGALLETFRQLPPGMATSAASLGETMVSLVTQSFQLGIRGAAPALAALTLSTIAMAVVGRSVPQLNVLSLGLGINSLVAMSVLIAAVGLTAHLLGNQLEPTLAALVESVSSKGDCPNFWPTKMGLSP